MIQRPLIKTLSLTCGLVVILLFCAGNAYADCPGGDPSSENQLQMLVLGDSIAWGQGLRREQKSWFRVKCWLQEKSGRPVREKIEAHSGAVIDPANGQHIPFQSNEGEVNLAFPTINEQLDRAVEYYGSTHTSVDLVLIDGCINDVGVQNLLSPIADPELLKKNITSRCGVSVSDLLQRVVTEFPRAYVMLTGYYRIVSSETSDNAFLRTLVKEINREHPEVKRIDDSEIRRRLIANSEFWYQLSNASLSEAVNKVNAELVAKGAEPRVSFVEIDYWPEHSFAAPETLLWNFIFGSTNLSGFRKILIILSLGSTAYKPNDAVREERDRSCKETFKAPKGVKEDPAVKKLRKEKLLVCRYASLGHPNNMGALVYSEAIKAELKGLIKKAGWERSSVSR